jgi:hypothetical protein
MSHRHDHEPAWYNRLMFIAVIVILVLIIYGAIASHQAVSSKPLSTNVPPSALFFIAS